MTLTLVREASDGDHTFGVLYANGVFFCHTLEDRIRPIKIKHETAIPTGRYEVVISMSPRFGRALPLLLDVPGFEGIRIHVGNTAADTSGCLLPGFGRGKRGVTQSRLAFNALFKRLVDDAPHLHSITIKDTSF